jgi:CDP-6-deoxy-D-xylo-4-hexulose-3-dehydrase
MSIPRRFALASDTFDEQEIEAALSILRSRRYTMGERVREFERAVAEWTGVEEAVMVNSGSSANLLLIYSLVKRSSDDAILLREGDEVIVPALSWPTTVWPIVQAGLVPVFVDVDPRTLAVDVESAARSLSPRTKAMFLIHVLGQSADMAKVQDFCKSQGLVLVEDCCESFGAHFGREHIGRFGVGGTFSHFFSHHLTTMEGGTIVTSDAGLVDDLRSLRAHGWIRDRKDREEIANRYGNLDPRFLFILPGFNVRPLELQAAIGLVQLSKLEGMLREREDLVLKTAALVARHTPWLRLIGSECLRQNSDRRDRRHSWMNMPFEVAADAPLTLKRTKEILEASGVETRPLIAGNIVRHPATSRITYRAAPSLENADRLLDFGFMIGCHSGSTEHELDVLERAFKRLGAS